VIGTTERKAKEVVLRDMSVNSVSEDAAKKLGEVKSELMVANPI